MKNKLLQFLRKEKTKNTLLGIFIFLVFVLIGQEFIQEKEVLDNLLPKSLLKPIKKVYRKFDFVFYYLTIIFAIFTFWINKEKIQKPHKSKNKKYWPIIVLVMIILVAFGLRFYNLGKNNFYDDEFQVMSTAYGYTQIKEFYKWDWRKNKSTKGTECGRLGNCHYTRAWPHTWTVAKSFGWFGVSEHSARLPSVFFGTLTILFTYLLATLFTRDKAFPLSMALTMAFCMEYIELARYSRMYAMVTPLFLVSVYLLYRGITEENSYRFKKIKLAILIKNYFNFNFNFLLPGIAILLFTGFSVHRNALVILPGIFLFFVFKAFLEKNKSKDKKYLSGSIIGISTILIILMAHHFNPEFLNGIIKYISFFKINNDGYLNDLTTYPLGELAGKALFFIAAVTSLFFKKGKNKDCLMFFNLSIVFALVFFIFIADRHEKFEYVSHLLPISLIIIFLPVFYALKNLSRSIIVLFAFLVTIFVGLDFYSQIGKIYLGQNSHPKYEQAFNIIRKYHDPQKDVLLTSYLRPYYSKKNYPHKLNNININESHYKLKDLERDLKKHNSGWVIWLGEKSGKINDEIKEYVCKNMLHVSGSEACDEKLDDTNVEIFYFNKSTNNRLHDHVKQ